jgi:hypothetical protein
MGRSLFAIAVGFILIAALSIGTDVVLMTAMPSLYEANGSTTSLPVLLLTIAYVGLYATGGCYLCARLAPSRPMRHALVLGALGLAFGVVGSITRWNMAPAWYHVLSMGLVMVYAWIGGWLREQELASQRANGLTGVRPA